MRKSNLSFKAVSTWSEVYRCLGGDENVRTVLEGIKKHGFLSTSVMSGKDGKMALCETLVSLEDRLELQHPKGNPLRRGLQSVRRRLEWEVYS